MRRLSSAEHHKIKESYAAEGRTYCEACGNSDADMKIDDAVCYDCKNPEETLARARADMLDYFYAYGEPDTD